MVCCRRTWAGTPLPPRPRPAQVNPQCESITVLVEVVVGLDASLVVMGSMGITSAGTQASFTTTFLVRVALPAIVVTRHTQ